MLYKSLGVLILILSCFITKSNATSRGLIEQIVTSSGVVLTPTKSAVTRVAKEGLGVIPELTRQQEIAREEGRQQDIIRQKEEVKRVEEAQHALEKEALLRKHKESRQREETHHTQVIETLLKQQEEIKRSSARQVLEKEELLRKQEEGRQSEEARHGQEREELLKQQEEIKRGSARQVQEKEELLKKQEEDRRREEARHAQEMSAIEKQLKETKIAHEVAQKRAQEIAREEVVTDDVLTLRAKLEIAEQERNELLSALTSLKGGQKHILGDKRSFIPYGESYIHDSKLKQPDTTLDEMLKEKLSNILKNVTSLLKELSADKTLKPVQKMLTKRQLERLREAADNADNFEASIFLRTFTEVQGQLPNLTTSPVFKEIESMTKWLEEERIALSKVGEHRVYVQRQLDVKRLIEMKTTDFDSFCEDYLDRVVADMCGWLTPTFTDEESVRNAKLDFRFRLLTNSIPVLNRYLSGHMEIFGTTDNFLTQTFMRIGKGKEYWGFKDVLQSYSSLFNNLGENVKLVEELLNYRFFQRRFQSTREKLKTMDLESIRDTTIRIIIQEMVNADVLSYNETKTSIFAASIPGALRVYMSKRAITAEESVVGREVEKILIAYTQIDAFSNNLRAGNPRVDEFHTHDLRR